MINSGGMAEQLAGQLLRSVTPGYVPPLLYYWQRGKKGSEAEIDYVIQHEHQIIPIEVKAGTTGSLKSLHQFMKEKRKMLAVRINSDVPSLASIDLKDSLGSSIQYTLLSLPFYLLSQIHRLINSSTARKGDFVQRLRTGKTRDYLNRSSLQKKSDSDDD